MNASCDIYLVVPLGGDSRLLRQLTIFQPEFSPQAGRDYQGFLGLALPRLKAVAVVTHLRQNGVAAFNVPTAYRDARRLSVEEARQLAGSNGLAMVGGIANQNPMFHVMRGSAGPDVHEGGGLVAIDALDGHRWTADEMAEYMHDFNNVI